MTPKYINTDIGTFRVNPVDDEMIYLNNAATTWPKPDCVKDAVMECISMLVYEPGRTTMKEQTDYPYEARKRIADLFSSGRPENVIFTQNATDSLNMAIHGRIMESGERMHVVTSDLEHNSVLRPLFTLRRAGKIDLSIIPSKKGVIDPAIVAEAIRPDTGMAVFTHGSNVLGTVQDLAAIGRILSAEDIFFVVDAAQTAGLLPVDFEKIHADALAFTGHKYLFGIAGTGGLVVRSPEKIAPVRQGGTGADSSNIYMGDIPPEKFEAGTHNYPGIASLWAGVDFINRKGIDEIRRKSLDMTNRIIGGISVTDRVIVYNENPSLPIILFNIEGIDCEDTGFMLSNVYSIVSRSGLHCSPLIHNSIDGGKGTVRLSLSFMNTVEECKKTVQAILEIASYED